MNIHPSIFSLGVLVICGVAAAENRTINGSSNATSDLGAAGQAFLRLAPAAYADGLESLGGASRANPRLISNTLSAQDESVANSRKGTDYLWQWGQFVDHDITQSPADSGEAAIIMVSDMSDPLFPMIPLTRTGFELDDANVRQQVNHITSFLDGSMVYGSDDTRALALRTMSGGLLKVDSNNLLPLNDSGLFMDDEGGSEPEDLRLAGDTRANEQPGLTALHTLFVREHNRLAEEIAIANSEWTDEEIYQRARKLNGAIIQAITYREWLPSLIGNFAPKIDSMAYDGALDPRISNEFATAFFRLGHTLVSPKLMRIRDDNFGDTPLSVEMREAFFAPDQMADEDAISHLLKGLACQQHQEGDLLLNDDLRNFLFGTPGQGGLDLAALNIQRGREHGLPDYRTMRLFFGLNDVTTWSDVTSDAAVQTKLAEVYSSPSDVDLWVGALAEDHAEGSALGELMSVAIAAEFERVAQADRFFYRWDTDLTDEDISMIESSQLGRVIERNSALTQVQENVFFLPEMPAKPELVLQQNGNSMELIFMVEPGFSYNYIEGNSPATFSVPVLETPLDGGETIYRRKVTSPDGSAEARRFYQLIRTTTE